MSDVDNKVKMIVEGLLLAAGRPLTLDNIIQVFSKEEQPDRKELKLVMESIAEDCADRGFELKEVASGFRFQVKQELSEWVAKLWEERPPRYTRALLETLALVAYRQPITRGDIEEIRGVGVSSNIVRTLLDREWIRVVGHRDVPGRPAMFATTKQFLDYFNLKSLQDLPPLSEIRDLAVADPEFDLEDDLADQRILELPEEVIDENSIELTDSDKADLIAEEEAIELSKKPLDEILQLPPELQYPTQVDEEDEEPDAEDVEFEEEFGIKELDETLEAIEAIEAIDSKVSESESESESGSAEGEGDTWEEESAGIEFSANDDDAGTMTQH
jgi:segregation and condensation protein B